MKSSKLHKKFGNLDDSLSLNGVQKYYDCENTFSFTEGTKFPMRVQETFGMGVLNILGCQVSCDTGMPQNMDMTSFMNSNNSVQS